MQILKRTLVVFTAMLLVCGTSATLWAQDPPPPPPGDGPPQDGQPANPGPQPSDNQGPQPGNNQGPQPGPQPGDNQGPQPGPQPGDNQGPQPGPPQDGQPANPGPQPGNNQGPQPGDNQGPRPGNNQGPLPGDNQGPQPGPQPGDNPSPQPGNNQGPQPGDNQGPQPGPQPGDNQGPQPGNNQGPQPGPQPGDGGFGPQPGDGGFGPQPGDGGFGPQPGDGGFGQQPGDGGFGQQPGDGGFGPDGNLGGREEEVLARFEEWLDSDEAEDLDGDEDIDLDDFALFAGFGGQGPGGEQGGFGPRPGDGGFGPGDGGFGPGGDFGGVNISDQARRILVELQNDVNLGRVVQLADLGLDSASRRALEALVPDGRIDAEVLALILGAADRPPTDAGGPRPGDFAGQGPGGFGPGDLGGLDLPDGLRRVLEGLQDEVDQGRVIALSQLSQEVDAADLELLRELVPEGQIDAEILKFLLDGGGPGDFGDFGPGGFGPGDGGPFPGGGVADLPPELLELLFDLQPEFEFDPELVIGLDELDLDRDSAQRLAELIGGEELTGEIVARFLGSDGGFGPGGFGPGDLGGLNLPDGLRRVLEGLQDEVDQGRVIALSQLSQEVDAADLELLRELVPEGQIDAEILKFLLGGGGPIPVDFGGGIGDGALPLDLVQLLFEVQAEFERDPELEIPWEDLVDDPEEADNLALISGSDVLTRPLLEELLAGGPGGGFGPRPGPGGAAGGLPPEIIDLLLELSPEFERDPELVLNLIDVIPDPDVARDVARLLGSEVVTAELLERVFADGPPDFGGGFRPGAHLPPELEEFLKAELLPAFEEDPELVLALDDLALDDLSREALAEALFACAAPELPVDFDGSVDIGFDDIDIDAAPEELTFEAVQCLLAGGGFAGGSDGPFPGGLPPEVIDLLLDLSPEFERDPELVLELADVIPDPGVARDVARLLGSEVVTAELLERVFADGPPDFDGGFRPGAHLPPELEEFLKAELLPAFEEDPELVLALDDLDLDDLSREALAEALFACAAPVPPGDFAEPVDVDFDEVDVDLAGGPEELTFETVQCLLAGGGFAGGPDGPFPGGPDGPFPGGPDGPFPGGELPPELLEYLAGFAEYFEENPDDFIALEDLEEDLEPRAIETLAQFLPAGGLDAEVLFALLEGGFGPGDFEPGPDPLFAFLEDLSLAFEEDPDLQIPLRQIRRDLDDPMILDFLDKLAGRDGRLSADEVLPLLAGGPTGPGGGEFPRLAGFEGVLEGVSLEERLIFVDGEAFAPADGLEIVDRDGRPIDVFALLELAGGFPNVEIALNDNDEVQFLRVFSRFDDGRGGRGDQADMGPQEFFGPLALIDEGKIIFKGPRFRVTDRTRFIGSDNQAGDLAEAPLGQPVSVTPGPPDAASGSPDPTALRVQLIDPRRPAQQSHNSIVGNLTAFDGDFVELAGPIAEWNEETVFIGADGEEVDPLSIEENANLQVIGRAPSFGEGAPVALEVFVLGDDIIGPPPPTDETAADRGRPADEIRIEGFIEDVGDDFLVLSGEVLRLDNRFQAFGLDGARTEVENIFAGDLIEVDTRPDGRGGFAITRIKVIDPSARTVGRPGVIVTTFDAIEGDELFTAGQFFAFASDLKVAGQGGRQIDPVDLEVDQYVRLTASPPRPELGEVLPVAFEVRVTRAPEEFVEEPLDPTGPGRQEDFFGPSQVKRQVRRSFPEDGDVEVPTFTKIEASFNGNVSNLIFDPEFEFAIFPEPLFFGELEISRDGRSIAAEVELEEDRTYQLAVISRDTGLFSINFSTGSEISSSSLAAGFVVPEELGRVKLLAEGSFAVLIEELAGDFDDFGQIEDKVVAGTPLREGGFPFVSVDPGTYFLAAFVGFEAGRGEVIEFEAFFDEDGDGEPDAITIGENENVEIELTLALPEPLQVVSFAPEPGTAAVALERAIEIEFNQPALLDPEGVGIFPPPEDILDFYPNEDFTVWTIEAVLAEDEIYKVVVEFAESEEGGVLPEPVATDFTTLPEFPELEPISGRLVLPHLPAARRFIEPIAVGALPAAVLERGELDFASFSDEDIVASTFTTRPEFELAVPPGDYVLAAFTRVEVPRGFRAQDPRTSPNALREFSTLAQDRFGGNALEVFDTIEIFGIFTGEEDGAPVPVASGSEGVELFMQGQAKTRQQILRITELAINGEPLVAIDGPPIVESGDAEINVRFNKQLRSDRGIVAIRAGLDGEPLRTFALDEDGRGVTFQTTLDEDAFHRFALFGAEARDGSRLDQPVDIGFATGEIDFAFASLFGRVALETRDSDDAVLSGDAADVIDAAVIFLMAEGEAPEELEVVGAAEVGADGGFSFPDVLPGFYQIYAEVATASGQDLTAIFDGDGDGVPDVLELGDGDILEELDLLATSIIATATEEDSGAEVKTIPPGGNAEAVVTLDLDPSPGDQGSSLLSNVDVGQEVTVDLYVSGASNLSGAAVKLTYDADILEFVSAVDQVSDRTNILRSNGGLALSLPPVLREPELEWGIAILGPSATNVGQGDGFLARFTFKVTNEFEGAQVILDAVTLNSTEGQDVLEPAFSGLFAPPVFTEQTKGIFSFDHNTAAGDQEEFHKSFVTAGSEVEVDVYINFDKISADFVDLQNYSVTVEFDPNQVTLLSVANETADEANVLKAAGGLVLELPAITTDRKVTFGLAPLGPTADVLPDQSGLVGRLTFLTGDDFTETDLLITQYAYKSLTGTQVDVSTIIISRMSAGEVTPVAAGSITAEADRIARAAGADFDGDGSIAFGDFFLFADNFGAADPNPAFDLDGNGAVDFGDFFIFADAFGVALSKLVAGDAPAAADGAMTLAARATGEGIALDLASEGLPLRGYAAVVEYDPGAFRFAGLSDRQSALRGDHPVLSLHEEAEGQVVVTGSRTGDRGAVEGLLAELRFVPLYPEAEGVFRLLGAQARGADGAIGQILDLGQANARLTPAVFALQPNFPNPFNPSTTIRYQLPADAAVTLEVYDVLGQKIRTLVADTRTAGFHRVVWDSRDDAQRQVAAGVYFYRLQAGEFTQTRKLLLLK